MNSAINEKTPLTQFTGPKYWPTWIGLWIMWLLAHLPFALQVKIGQFLGLLAYYLARQRREICRINIKLCFPELTATEQQELVRKSFISNGIAVMEVALGWCRNIEDFRSRVSISGLENLRAAKARGRGVLLVCAHFSTLEFAGALLTLFEDMDVTYRKHKNLLFDAVMSNARKRHFLAVVERKNVRDTYKRLKQGHTLWYAPDQDYGAKHSVFVPFFGVEAATITATSRFASANDSAVLFFAHYRNKDNTGYLLEISPTINDYPSDDEVADATKINDIIEKAIRKAPDQYLWMHKRFKTQAAGKMASPYYKKPR